MVDILGTLDEKIEYYDTLTQKLERQGEFIFKEIFEDSTIEKELCEFCKIATFYNGYSYSGDELSNNSAVGLVTIKNFERNGGFKIDGFKPITITGKIKPTMYAEVGDLLVAHTDLTQNADIVGNPILLLNLSSFEKTVISMDLVKVVSTIPNEILYYVLKSKDFKTHALGYCSGTTVLHLNKKALQEYCFEIPKDKMLLENLSEKLKIVFDRIKVVIQESQKLKELKNLYLQKFFG